MKMLTALTAIGPLLAILAILLMRRKERRPVAALILGAVLLALLSVPVSILTAAVVFTSGFQKMASQGAGGVGPVSGLCLGVTRQLLVGAVAVLSSVLVIGGMGLLHHRDDSPAAEPRPPGRGAVWRWVAILGLSTLPVVGLGAVAEFPERLVRLIMLAVDPSRQSEAQAALGSMDVSQFSAHLATITTWALGGALATALLLAAVSPCVVLLVRPIEHTRGMRGYAWAYLIAVALFVAWRLSTVLSLEAWVGGAQP
jgi:hypothetical protein